MYILGITLKDIDAYLIKVKMRLEKTDIELK